VEAELMGTGTHFMATHMAPRPYEYRFWVNAKWRCFSEKCPSFKDYGARGITMHGPWVSDPVAFVKWVRDTLGPRPSKRHSLDRVDNALGYEPGNLRWANWNVQQRNRRSSKLTSEDIECIRFWAIAGIPQRDLGAAFGVTQSHVSHIKQGDYCPATTGGV
jgi:hypothetical protein